MAHNNNPAIVLNGAMAYEQLLSPLFQVLPQEIRLKIYQALIYEDGNAQHVYAFSAHGRLVHYACLAEPHEYHDHSEPAHPDTPANSGASDDGDEAGTGSQANNMNLIAGILASTFNQTSAAGMTTGMAAGMAAVAGPSQAHAAGADAVTTGQDLPDSDDPSGDDPPTIDPDDGQWVNSPWCDHRRCYAAYMHQYGYSWDRAHSRNHTMGNNIAAGNPGIALPLLVCKRMRDEAADVLYGTTHFKFHDTDVLERFMGAVSPLHGSKLRFVDIKESTPVGQIIPPRASRGGWTRVHNGQYSLLPGLCQTLGTLLPNVIKLRLTLHIADPGRHDTGLHSLPDNQWFQALWTLRGSINPRCEMSVKLVVKCADTTSCSYGDTPAQFDGAPFNVALVQQGWHCDSQCVPFSVAPSA